MTFETEMLMNLEYVRGIVEALGKPDAVGRARQSLSPVVEYFIDLSERREKKKKKEEEKEEEEK